MPAMVNLKFRQENEVKLEYAPRITEVDWDRYADAVKNMHEERKTRRQILDVLNQEHDFRPSMAQLNTHMRKRKLRVYGKAGDGGGHAVEATEAELLPVKDEILPVTNGIMLTKHRVIRDADSVPSAEVAPASNSFEARVIPDTSFTDMLDLLPLNLGATKPNGTQVYGEGAEENEDEVRGRRMSDSGDKSIRATLEDFEKETEVLLQHAQERIPSLSPHVMPREASVCSFRSHYSDSSSLGVFREFAADVSRAAQLRRQNSQSSLRSLTILSEESWNFDSVTGMPSNELEISSRRVPSAASWEAHRSIITELFTGMNLSLKKIRDCMETSHEFAANSRMYNLELRRWDARRTCQNKIV